VSDDMILPETIADTVIIFGVQKVSNFLQQLGNYDFSI
jgi:hypothetical protein